MAEKLLRELDEGTRTKLIEAFESRLIRRGEDECWGWKGALDGKEYGRVRLPNQDHKGNRYIRAPRISFELYKRPLKRGELVRHSCDNPPCPNPKHLLAGTHADNRRDAVERGRNARGEKNGWAKITEEQAKEIRRYLEAGEFMSDIAKEMGCGYGTVEAIGRGETWRHLGPMKRKRKAASECELRKRHNPWRTRRRSTTGGF